MKRFSGAIKPFWVIALFLLFAGCASQHDIPEDETASESYTKGKFAKKVSDSAGTKTVHVKSYTRKNGTNVRPHTRSAPKRK